VAVPCADPLLSVEGGKFIPN